ncbi:hypothetical protein H4S14_001393 [Agrobacterium vitis]|nr:hypothetical protein [Agrobacterium vitis]MBE1437655.1 hypothetical protein [Agrobacterium vitis]
MINKLARSEAMPVLTGPMAYPLMPKWAQCVESVWLLARFPMATAFLHTPSKRNILKENYAAYSQCCGDFSCSMQAHVTITRQQTIWEECVAGGIEPIFLPAEAQALPLFSLCIFIDVMVLTRMFTVLLLSKKHPTIASCIRRVTRHGKDFDEKRYNSCCLSHYPDFLLIKRTSENRLYCDG